MLQKKLVSIIIPTFNAGKYIKKTVDSIINQTYNEIEILIVDDCSTDDTKNILSSYITEKKIQFYQLDKNSGGPAKPRNIGIEKAKGSWLAFCDSDDIWHPQKIEIQLEYMNKTKCEFSCTKKQNFVNDDSVYFKHLDSYSAFNISYRFLLLKDFIPTSSVVIKKDLVKLTRFNETKRMVSVEDYLFWLSILKFYRNGCKKINKKLVYYRISPNQISKNKWKRIPQFIEMFSTHFSNKPLFFKILNAMTFTTTHYTISLLQKIFKKD